jgi:TfuA protein
MHRIIVFLGPSLNVELAKTILPAEYRPPAKRGDLLRAAEDGAEIIGLIDGVFHQESAVAHREILVALRKGIRVVGASSMGALRAAEMDTLGMVGIGDVYRMYKSGVLESDDEVALVFDPDSGYPLSEPLVNIRYTLRKARDSGVLSGEEHDALLAAARSVFYPLRTYARITESTGETLDERTKVRFLAWAGENACDRKQQDAIEALEYIREMVL